ncbi:fatty-acid amide hydrolase 2 isoform X4 [Sus scrofa]|uniref:fatty-acid amide hydrolase 2 isoform X4 n=1 Tax=Sus scrofa TaxID=9823 RepID=UPI0003AECF44|nr:fatty-acid amide hydrolase 2 isoform X4 [Sus scrofa]
MALPFTIRIQLLLLRAVGFLIGLIGQAARAFGGPKFSSGTTRPVTEPLLLLSGVQLAKLIRQRKVKCIDVVQAYINRIKDVNPMINGIVKYRSILCVHTPRRPLVESQDLFLFPRQFSTSSGDLLLNSGSSALFPKSWSLC